MIQRKQTLYLFISGLLMLAVVLLDSLKLILGDMVYHFNAMGIYDVQEELIMPTWVLFGLVILITLLSFVTIFLYTKRVLQRRITVFNLFLKVGVYALGWYYVAQFLKAAEEVGSGVHSLLPTVVVALPLVAIIFDYLAARAIEIDERTIRSINRLR